MKDDLHLQLLFYFQSLEIYRQNVINDLEFQALNLFKVWLCLTYHKLFTDKDQLRKFLVEGTINAPTTRISNLIIAYEKNLKYFDPKMY